MTITVRYSSVDCSVWTRTYATADKARAAIREQLGPPELGSTYAVSGDGICKAEIISGATMRELFKEQTQ